MFPTFALPVALNVPLVARLPPVIVPVDVIIPPVPILPMFALLVTLNDPDCKLPITDKPLNEELPVIDTPLAFADIV